MARRFAYVSFGILCLVVAHQLGVEKARADWDPSLTGNILGASALAGAGPIIWNQDGEALRWNYVASSWDRAGDYDLPVAVAEIKILDTAALYCVLVTRDDRVYWIPDHEVWRELPSPLIGPVAVESGSWGSVKSLFREKQD